MPRTRSNMRNDENFLAEIARGLIPRRFLADHLHDRVIYEEDQEVAEMYFVLQGFVGIAINHYGSVLQSGQFEIGRKQKGS